MSEQEYLDQRVNDQISWYESKSGSSKRRFRQLKMLETVLALMIPFLAGFITDGPGAVPIKFTVGLIGVLVAVTTNAITLFKLQENWIQYRTIAEALKQEKFLYVTQAGPYKSGGGFPDFVERCEQLIAKENTQWASYIQVAKKEDGDE